MKYNITFNDLSEVEAEFFNELLKDATVYNLRRAMQLMTLNDPNEDVMIEHHNTKADMYDEIKKKMSVEIL